ncbi:MAG: DUF1266 domain-containing protein [Gordonia sp. (in: high G+C Gram-positive bacteria)]|uniref:DUF1266 domain-containing protein n=1 Tax=Gordonia sp. (in: high G+C Gram-positive bacteria) TaxID=84139 RepID=UPI0039E6A2A2
MADADDFDDLAASLRMDPASTGADVGWVRPAQQPRIDRSALVDHALADVPADPDGPLYSHLAQGLALGGLTAVATETPWNSLRDLALPAYQLRVELERIWGIHNAEDWFAVMASMIGFQEFSEAEAMLDARGEAVARGGYTPDDYDGLWRQWLIDRDFDADVYEGTHERLATVTAVDDWLRDCGLLAPDGHVGTIAGYAIEWAVRLARAGHVAGYADEAEAVQMILTARDSAARIFASWTEYAVSVVAGTLLHHDGGWDTIRTAVATLLTVDHSPWRALPFPLSDLPAQEAS